MAGLKANNLTVGNPNYSWEDLYGIDAGALTHATRDNFKVLVFNNSFALCIYTGTGALTTSEFNSLPIGSVIVETAIATPVIIVKKDATTWATI